MLSQINQDRQTMEAGELALVGGVQHLRQGQQAETCLNILFRNSSNILRDKEIVGQARLKRNNRVDPE